MHNQSLLALYESVADTTSQMLNAAKAEDWERLSELEQTCVRYVEQIKSYEPIQPLTGAARESKVASIKRILADDREIRSLVEPWMNRLSALLSNNEAEQKLARTYGSGAMFR